MKKLLYTMGIAGILLSACNPMDDVYSDADKAKDPYKEQIKVALEEADYTTMANYYKAIAKTKEDSSLADKLKNNKAFSESVPTDKFIPLFIKNEYLALNKNSSAQVTFNFDEGETETQVKYEGAVEYELTEADYISVGGKAKEYGFFMPSIGADPYIPTILKNGVNSPNEGDIRLVKYQYSKVEVTGPTTTFLLAEDFESYAKYADITENGWESTETSGGKLWYAKEYNANKYATPNTYKASGLIETKMISPIIDLSKTDNNWFTFDIQVDYWKHDGLKVFISEDKTAWTDVSSNFTIPTTPTDGFGTFASAGKMDLSAYKGKSIYIAFDFVGDLDNGQTTTFRIDNISVFSGVTYPTDSEYEYYKYDGTEWKKDTETVRIILSAEYDAMGAPGKYDNFSSSMSPVNYIPTFCTKEYPYAQAGDIKPIAYHYYADGSTNIQVANYIKTATDWELLSNVVEKTEPYVMNGKDWVFDPTVRFTMAKDDYKLIVEEVKKDHPELVYKGDSEYYYGASAYYNNFDMRNSKRTSGDFAQTEYKGLTADQIQDKIKERVQEAIVIMLGKKFPNAVPQVNGVDVNYVVTYKVYDNDSKKLDYAVTYKCTAAGSPAKFEFVEGPTKVE